MRPRWSNAILIVVGAGCLTPTLVAQVPTSDRRAVIAGRVTERGTMVGLRGVDVRIAGDSVHVATDSAGNFLLATTGRGTSVVLLRKIGYDPLTVPLELNPGDSLHIATGMGKTVTNLDTLKVVGKSETVPSARLTGCAGGRFLSPFGHGRDG